MGVKYFYAHFVYMDFMMKSKLKKMIRIVWKIFLVFLIYQAAGAIIPSMIHLDGTTEKTENFDPVSCYSDEVGTERVRCIDDNMDALAWRIRAIESAEDEIILSTFELYSDNSGNFVMSALSEAADRGVKVRILVDGMMSTGIKRSQEFQELTSLPDVEAKFYNPVNILRPWKYTFRLHDKYLIVDDRLYISGGRNTNDLFLGEPSDDSSEDRDLLIYETDAGATDTSLSDLKVYFDKIWNSEDCKTVNAKSRNGIDSLQKHYDTLSEEYPYMFEDVDWTEVTMPTNKVTYFGGSERAWVRHPELYNMLLKLMTDGDNVTLQTPYIISSSNMYNGLKQIADSTNSFEIRLFGSLCG